MIRTCKTCRHCVAPSYLDGEHRCIRQGVMDFIPYKNQERNDKP